MVQKTITALRCGVVAIDENEGFVVGLFTALLVWATYFLWDEAQETSKRQLRAYLTVDFDKPGVRPRMPEDGTNFVTIRVTNRGKTPAAIEGLSFRQFVSKDLDAVPVYEKRPESIHVRLGPGQDYYELRRFPKEVDRTQSFFGYVDYSDVFGSKWRVGYGYWFKPRRDAREIYGGDDAAYNARMNLVPIGSPGYNYERKHAGKREPAEVDPPPAHEESMTASVPISASDIIYMQTKPPQ
jgi:hypothetical protein